MVVNIGQDCWDKIMEFKKDMEEAELRDERLTMCHIEMFHKKVDSLTQYIKQRKTCRYYKQHHNWNKLKPITLFFSKRYILEQIYNDRRPFDNLMIKMFLNHRHFKVRIILIDDLGRDHRIPSVIHRNIPTIEGTLFRRELRRFLDNDFYMIGLIAQGNLH